MKLETHGILKTLYSDNDHIIELDDDQLYQLKSIVLMIAKDIIDVSEELHLTYHITGGTALGAFRHKGFIPWDDDIDIDMERKDIDTFVSAMTDRFSDKYWINYYKSDEKNCIPSIQVRLKGTKLRGIMDANTDDCGVFVDVFVIENAPNNAFLRKIHGIGSLGFGFATSCRTFYRDREYLLNLVKNNEDALKATKLKINIGRLLSFMSLKTWTNMYVKWNSLCKNNDSTFVTVPCGRKHYFGELDSRSNFCDTCILEFEGFHWKAPKEIQKYLTRLFSKNYMQLPPEEDREKHILVEYDLGKYTDMSREDLLSIEKTN